MQPILSTQLNPTRPTKVITLPLGLVKGLNEVCKALDRKEAVCCVLAKNCDDPKYLKLVDALAKTNNIPVIQVEDRTELGEWLGHCKYDKEGAARKVKGTSSVAIINYGEETECLSFVLNYIKENSL
jgi:small subunit ribosomal protein S12e